MVHPDYRLLPEATGNDILDDVADFYVWLQKDFPTGMANTNTGIEPDLENIVVRGESAGGYLAIQSGLLHPEMRFKAIIAQYPVLDVLSPFFSEKFDYDKKINGIPSPDARILHDHLAHNIDIVTGDESLARAPVMLALINEGLYFDYLSRGANSEEARIRVQPLRCLEPARTEQIPFMFVYHGRQDTGVPVEGTELFEKRLKELHPDAAARFVCQDGPHGFDSTATLSDVWLMEGLADVERYWPK